MPAKNKPIERETFELNAVDNSPGPRAVWYSASVQVELPGGTLLQCPDSRMAAALAASINATVTHVHAPVITKQRQK